MIKLLEFQRNLSTFDLHRELVGAVEDTKEDIVTLNQGQLFIGVNNKGEEIQNQVDGGTGYSYMWGEYRQSLGLQIDHYDLKVTGTFWASIKVDVTNTLYITDSTDPKYSGIQKLFGDQLLGLSPQSKEEEYVPLYLKPALIRRIESKLKVSFT